VNVKSNTTIKTCDHEKLLIGRSSREGGFNYPLESYCPLNNTRVRKRKIKAGENREPSPRRAFLGREVVSGGLEGETFPKKIRKQIVSTILRRRIAEGGERRQTIFLSHTHHRQKFQEQEKGGREDI